MQEPLTIRIERMQHGRRTPIPPPDSNAGGPPGTGWTKDEIRNIETFLLTQWCGGGLYDISLTDSADPPISMKWQPNWNTNEYPQLVPPPLTDARNPEIIDPTTPTGARMPLPLPTPMPPPPQVGTPQYNSWREEAQRRTLEEENRRLRDHAEARENEAREQRHRAELERERQANEQRFSKLESAIGSLASSMKDTLKELVIPRGPSASELEMRQRFETLQEENRRTREQADNERREREAERREREFRDSMRTQGEEAHRRFELLQRQLEQQQTNFQQALTAMTAQINSSANKNDPLILLMQEQSRHNAETLRAMAANSQAQMQQLTAFMMDPAKMVELARESQKGADEAVSRTTKFMDTMMVTQQRIFEQALQMQPSPSGVVDVVKDGINGVQSFLERYVSLRSKAEQSAHDANVRMAQAQAQAIEAQARAANPAAFVNPPGQLSGPSAESVPAAPPPQPPASTAPAVPERLWGRTDAEWFGPAFDEVLELREGVKEFLEACNKLHAEGKTPDKIADIPGKHPKDIVDGIMLAAQFAQQNGIIVPAMIDLLVPGHLTQFITVLLPDASAKYRDDVLTLLQQAGQAPDEDDEDDDGADDEEEEGEIKPPPRRNGRPRARA